VSDPLKIGVIGAGYWGPNLVRNFNQLQDSRVDLVCDLDESRLKHIQSLYPHVQVSTNYQDATLSKDLDAVCVATPAHTHYKIAMEALEQGKHVFVEKPMTACQREAEEMVAKAAEMGLTLMVDHTFAYAPAVNHIKELIGNGELGKVYYVNMSRLNLGLIQRDINVIWDLAPHDISILCYVLGDYPIRASAHGNCNILEGIEDVAMVSLHFPGNVVAFLHLSWLDPCKQRRATFVGSRKMLVYDDVEQLEKIKIHDKGVEDPPHYDTFGEFQLSYRYGDISAPYVENQEPLTIECRHFLDCIKSGDEPITSGDEGLKIVRVIEACQRSLNLGGQTVDVSVDGIGRMK
jgi:predicted dehydrogenase